MVGISFVPRPRLWVSEEHLHAGILGEGWCRAISVLKSHVSVRIAPSRP